MDRVAAPLVDLVSIEARASARLARMGVPGEDKIVVGCSGGADSTALVLVLAASGRPLHVVYVDHGLRAGTDAEAAQVARLAAAAGATFECVHVLVERRGNLMARARAARYAALARAARAVGARWVAVGHTADDQAETVAFRAERGDVEHALAGMPEARSLDGGGDVVLVRPLLDARRHETDAFVRARGIVPVADPSNELEAYTRVRLRRALAAGDATASLLHEASEMAARVALLDAEAAALGPLDALPAGAVCAAGPAVALRLLRRAGVWRAGRAHAEALVSLCRSTDGSRSLDLGRGLTAERNYGLLRLGVRPPEVRSDVEVAIAGPGTFSLPGFTVSLRLARVDEPGPHLAESAALGPLVLRNFRPGDRLRTALGGRKLHDVLIDRKVPRAQRRHLPLVALAGGSEVVWAWGIGLSHAHRAAAGARARWVIDCAPTSTGIPEAPALAAPIALVPGEH